MTVDKSQIAADSQKTGKFARLFQRRPRSPRSLAPPTVTPATANYETDSGDKGSINLSKGQNGANPITREKSGMTTPTLRDRLKRLGSKRAPTPSAASQSAPARSEPPQPLSNNQPMPYPEIKPEPVVVLSPPPSTPPPSSTPPTPSRTTSSISMPPATLAQRITALISSLPALASSSYTPTAIMEQLTLANPEIIRYLSNPRIMNGKGQSDRSVWAALERVGLRGRGNQESMMLCAPLDAQSDADVEEVEPSEIEIEIDDTDGENEVDGNESDERVPKEVQRDEPEVVGLEAGPGGSENAALSKSRGKSKDKAAKPKKNKKVKIFLPSKTRVSFKATWWGFVLYLPPPVLIMLNDTHIDATKRAAMLLAAMQWILSHVPTKGIPPQAAATIKVFRTLLPLIGAMGAAISAAWSGIRSYDRGLGVKLSATWVMPLVMIPSSWEMADDFPQGMLPAEVDQTSGIDGEKES